MMIRFQFDIEKAIEMMAFLIDRLGETDKIKLVKLIVCAEKEHFLQHGRPITGDRLVAMPWGPVPSACLQLIDGHYEQAPVFDYLHVFDNKVSLRSKHYPHDRLTDSERAVLEQIIEQHGAKDTWPFVRETEQWPEYLETYQEDTSTTIPYETILKHYHAGDESKFRRGRPVISPQMAQSMYCPTSRADREL